MAATGEVWDQRHFEVTAQAPTPVLAGSDIVPKQYHSHCSKTPQSLLKLKRVEIFNHQPAPNSKSLFSKIFEKNKWAQACQAVTLEADSLSMNRKEAWALFA